MSDAFNGDQNLQKHFYEEEKLNQDTKAPDWSKVEAHFLGAEEKSSPVDCMVIKNEPANKDNANVTTADKFSNDFIYAKDGWHEIFQFCLANGMDKILEQYPQEQHNTGVKAVKLFIHHLIGAKLDSSGSL